MTIECKSYVIGHKFINPINECGVKYPPNINQICGYMGWPCPEVSNNAQWDFWGQFLRI